MSVTIDSVLAKAKAYYTKPGNGCGGSLHIVLDDGNTEPDHVQWCIDHAIETDDEDGVALATDLLALSQAQRDSVYARLHGHPEPEEEDV